MSEDTMPILLKGETAEHRVVDTELVRLNHSRVRNKVGIDKTLLLDKCSCVCENACGKRIAVGEQALVVSDGNIQRVFCSVGCQRQEVVTVAQKGEFSKSRGYRAAGKQRFRGRKF